MNINSKLNREEEAVIVSNKEGIMDVRNYQDNIDEILILEDVIEELEIMLSKETNALDLATQKLEDKDLEVSEVQKSRKKFWKRFILTMLIAPILGSSAFAFFLTVYEQVPISVHAVYSALSIEEAFAIGAFCDTMALMAMLCEAPASLKPSVIKNLKKEKEEIKKRISEYELKIYLLKTTLFENKNTLQYMLKEKSKSNIANMSTEIKNVNYYEALEQQKAYLEKLYQDNCEKQEPSKQENMILGRFKKRKKGN